MSGEKKIETSRTRSNPCLRCQAALDAASGPGAPKPGDFSVCFECANLAVFADDMSLREPTDEESRIAATDQNIVRVVKMVKALVQKQAAKFN